jgi:carbamate kinase
VRKEIVVIALGGNAILQPGQRGTIEEQLGNVNTACKHLVEIAASEKYEMVITHGNGPQVGNLLLQNEAASSLVAPMPLDVCGAGTQGMMGYIIQQRLANQLRAADLKHHITTVVTQVIVDRDDPAFKKPSKPIGPFYSWSEARRLRGERGWEMMKDGRRGYRRVVASPKPLEIQETRIIRNMLENEEIVIAVGGGGIPVVREDDRSLRGVEAVVDKDLAAERLAENIGAEVLVILTDVEQAMLNYGAANEAGIDRMTGGEARKYMEAGINFVESGGRKAVITALNRASEALSGRAGTTIVP